jgi:hypothetical protein
MSPVKDGILIYHLCFIPSNSIEMTFGELRLTKKRSSLGKFFRHGGIHSKCCTRAAVKRRRKVTIATMRRKQGAEIHMFAISGRLPSW